jgi:hypothetical protein
MIERILGFGFFLNNIFNNYKVKKIILYWEKEFINGLRVLITIKVNIKNQSCINNLNFII